MSRKGQGLEGNRRSTRRVPRRGQDTSVSFGPFVELEWIFNSGSVGCGRKMSTPPTVMFITTTTVNLGLGTGGPGQRDPRRLRRTSVSLSLGLPRASLSQWGVPSTFPHPLLSRSSRRREVKGGAERHRRGKERGWGRPPPDRPFSAKDSSTKPTRLTRNSSSVRLAPIPHSRNPSDLKSLVTGRVRFRRLGRVGVPEV